MCIFPSIRISFSVALLIFSCSLWGQQGEGRVVTLDDAVNMAISNHPQSKNAALSVEAAKARLSGSVSLNPAQLSWEHGQLYSPVNDSRFTVSQDFGSPVTHIRRHRLYSNESELSLILEKISRKQLIAAVKGAYFRWVHQISVNTLILRESDLYEELLLSILRKYEQNDSLILEKTLAELKFAEIQRKVMLSEEQLKLAVNALNRQMYSEEPVQPDVKELDLYTIRFTQNQSDKFYPYTFKDYFQQQVNNQNAGLELEKSYLFPGISAGYFHQRVGPVKNLQGFQIGLTVPLWFQPQVSRIKEARIQRDMAMNEAVLNNYELEQTIDDLKIKLDQEFINVIYFRENALKQADLLIETAVLKLQKQAISYTEYLQIITEAIKIKEEYLRSILNYNLTAVELEYYLN